MRYVEIQGVQIPALGLGTWRLSGDACRRAVAEGLELGYRHIDTAQMYGNEGDIGAVLRDAGVAREELFLVTKIANTNHGRDQVLATVPRSLEQLGVDAVDLLLIHWPVEFERVGETLEAMVELQGKGLVRHLGVSNFSVAQMESAMQYAPLLANQVKHHPFERQDAVREACVDADMTMTAYSPLAKGQVLDSEVLTGIGESYGKSATQVTLRWLLDQPGVTAIPKASSREHLAANLDVFDFSLTDEDRARIDALAS